MRANAKQSSETVITRSDKRRSNRIHVENDDKNNAIATFRYTPLAIVCVGKKVLFLGGELERGCNDVDNAILEPSPAFVTFADAHEQLLPLTEREGNRASVGNMKENNFAKVYSLFTTHHSLIHPDTDFSRFTSHFSLKRAAFTLAEVLITLGIIGVVAAMTMPSLVASYQKQQVVAQLKKAYTELSQTLKMAEAENGPIDSWDVTSMNKSQEGADLFANTFLVPYIKTIKTCFPSTSECWADDVYNLNGSKVSYLGNNRAEFNSFVTVSGYSVYYWLNGDGRGGWLWVDLNGPKKPNIIGKDVFAFTMRWISSSPAGAVACERKLGVLMIGATCKAETSPRAGLFSGNFTNGVSDYKCKKGAGGSWAGTYCGALIMQDGWTISKDYPW